MSSLPLPQGWIQQYDSNYNHTFWVDTRANPPRSIWVHPYEDEQFLATHPEIKAERAVASSPDLDEPPPYDVATGESATGVEQKPSTSSHPDVRKEGESHTDHRRGVFGRLKDKAIGTKEEREEQRRVRAEQAAQAEERARRARMQELAEREAYMRAHGGYAPYRPSYTDSQPGLGGNNPAGLIMGGLLGGLLLGDLLGGGF